MILTKDMPTTRKSTRTTTTANQLFVYTSLFLFLNILTRMLNSLASTPARGHSKEFVAACKEIPKRI